MPAAGQRDEIVAAATRYLNALVSHDAEDVPLAPDVWRTEEGRNTGLGAADIRARMASEPMRTITAVRDVRWYVEGPDAVAFYLLDAGGATAHVAERFRVAGGLIQEIEAIFFISPVANEKRWPDDPAEVWPAEDVREETRSG